MPALTLPVQIETNRILIPGGATSQNIKDAITAAPADSQIVFTGTCDVSAWGATPFVLDKRLWFVGDGCGVLNGTTAYTMKLFDVRAPLRVRGMKFYRLGSAFEFNAVSGSKLDFVEFERCEFWDVVNPILAPLTSGGSPTIGVKRLLIDACECDSTNLTLHDPGAGARASDGNPFIDFEAPGDAIDVVKCYGRNLKRAGVRIGTNVDTYAGNWKKVLVDGFVLESGAGGQPGTASTNNFEGVHITGVQDGVVVNCRISDIETADNDDAEGIYVMVERGDVSHNTLYNAGHHDAAIVVKGDPRAGGTVNAPGYRVRVTNNHVTATSTYTDSKLQNTRGIRVLSEDILVAGNDVEGVTGECYDLSTTQNDGRVDFFDNVARNHRLESTSDAAVRVNVGKFFNSRGNTILQTPKTGISGRGFRIQPDNTGTRTHWHLEGDTVQISGGGSSSRGFMVVASSDITLLEFIGCSLFGTNQGIRFDTGVLSHAVVTNCTFHSDVGTPIFFNTGATPTRYQFKDNPGRLPQNIVFADLDPSPSVASEDGLYIANYTAATPIGKFDGLVAGDNGECRGDGEIISVWCGESDTFHIQHNDSIRTQKGEDYLTADELAYKIRQFIRKAPQWLEITSATGSAATNSNRRVPAPVIVMARPLPQVISMNIASRGKV